MAAAEIDWSRVGRVLVIRLRSIGDTVLTTPSLIALRKFLPEARIDVLLEDWVAPVLDGFHIVDEVVTVGESNSSRLATAREMRARNYDVVLNLHGGTTANFLTYATGARHRVGYRHYRYAFLHNHLVGSAAEFWQRDRVHSAEQHMALLGSVGVPVSSDQKTLLSITREAAESLQEVLAGRLLNSLPGFALLHPAAAFATKQWPTEHFARTAEFLAAKGFQIVAVAAKSETEILVRLKEVAQVPILTFDELALPQITALADRAAFFVGNDSGIAHIAAAVGTPSVVIFGSSNRDHWSPWTDASHEIVFSEFNCQPCSGHTCAEFGEPKCILGISTDNVFAAVERVLEQERADARRRPPD